MASLWFVQYSNNPKRHFRERTAYNVFISHVLRLHCFMRRDLCGTNNQLSNCRVLALVGSAPLGEGFFEVFATVVAVSFVRLGLLGIKSATNNVLFATIIFLSGGILEHSITYTSQVHQQV